MVKKVIALALAVVTALSLLGCAQKAVGGRIGSGTPGVVEKISWDNFDELYEKSKAEIDINKRALILHEMEDMLMDTGAIIPVSSRGLVIAKKKDVSGVLTNSMGIEDFSRVKKTGSDTVRLQLCAEMDHLDYNCLTTYDAYNFSILTQGGLMCLDENCVPHYNLAQDIEVSDDGLTYTITLRPGLKWSDGTDFGASDFVYSWKRVADPQTASNCSDKMTYIAGYPDDLHVYASEDDRVLTVELVAPCPFFTSMLSYHGFFPVQQEFVESAEGFKDDNGKIVNPNAWAKEAGMPSIGPYILTSWKHNESMTLKKNPLYWDADSIVTENLELMISTDATTTFSAYKTGDLDACVTVPSDEISNLDKSGELIWGEQYGENMFMFNVNSDIWAGYTKEEAATIRKALALIVDRRFIVGVCYSGRENVRTVLVPYNITDGGTGCYGNVEGYTYPHEDGYYSMEPDFDKAREMLRSVGFEFDKEGKLTTPFTIEYMTNSGIQNEAMAACLQQDFAEIGVQLTIKVEDWNVFLDDRERGNYQMARHSWTTDYNDPIGLLEIYLSSSPNNDSQLGK